MLISKDHLLTQHSSLEKFAIRWRGPFVVTIVHPNATYTVRELDGSVHAERYAGKRVKLFKRREQFHKGEKEYEDDQELDFQSNGGDNKA